MTVQQRKFKVLLVGDTCLDRFIYIDTQTRINSEAPQSPLGIVLQNETKTSEGMVSNVQRNLNNLGISTITYKSKYPGINTRYIEKHSEKQLLRVLENNSIDNSLVLVCMNSPITFDAIVIADYCRGLITHDTILELQDIAKTHNIPIFLDTKKTDLEQYTNCIVKINNYEYSNLKTLPSTYIVTMGDQGAFTNTGLVYPALDVTCVDVCGAGDAFMAGLVYGTLIKAEDAICYGIVNGSISVKYPTTYNPSLKELEEGMEIYRNTKYEVYN